MIDVKIYVDLDDVVCDTTSVIVRECNSIYGRSSRLDDIYSFELQESLDLTKDQHNNLMDHIHSEEIQMQMEPIDGAVEYLNVACRRGIQIHIVTGRPPSTYDSTIRWLGYHDVPFDELIFVNKYNRLDNKESVAIQVSFDQIVSNDYKAIIEDSPSAIELSLSLFSCPVIFFSKPWNREYACSLPESKRLYVCDDWEEINKVLDKEV